MEKDKNSKKGEEKRIRAYFVRLLGKYDFRNEQQFISFGKWLIFIILLIVEALILLEHIAAFSVSGGWQKLIAIVVVVGVLTVSQALKLFVVKKKRARLLFYALDALAASMFLFVTTGIYPIVVYMLVLTEFYMSAEKTRVAIVMLCIGVPIYAASYALHLYFQVSGSSVGRIDGLQLATEAFGSVFVYVVHFLVVQVALAFYRQFLRLEKTLKELKESKKELEKAYEVVAEVTALEERQRIAKEIHDTAGHSLTTVIMQTESAKLILSSNPEEAKQKIVAANLQAKHALEELRDSVHLLSGTSGGNTLKTELERIIHESTDGTGITIRSEIEDVEVSPAKFRFICNTLKEGISNGLRHGGATAFWFELKASEDKIGFLLSDNGKGLDTKEWKLGFGLTTMRERARLLGGEVRFDSEAEEGFELRLILPADKP